MPDVICPGCGEPFINFTGKRKAHRRCRYYSDRAMPPREARYRPRQVYADRDKVSSPQFEFLASFAASNRFLGKRR